MIMNGTTTQRDYEDTMKRLEKRKELLKETKNKLSQKMEENDHFYETVGKLENLALANDNSIEDLQAQRRTKEEKAKEIEKLLADVDRMAVECRNLEEYAMIQKYDVERRKQFNKRPEVLCPSCNKPYKLTRLGQSRRLKCGHAICTACAIPQIESDGQVTCPIDQETHEVEDVDDLPLDHLSVSQE